MKSFFRLLGIGLLLACAPGAWAQATGPKIDDVKITFVGPASVSEQFIRGNIRLKAGDTYLPNSTQTQDDVHALYATGQFYTIQVFVDRADDGGVVITYKLQAQPRITEIKLAGNKELSDTKLKKKITVKVGDPMDEQKLFTDVQEMKKLYEKYGHPDTQIQYVPSVDELNGRATVTFEIIESVKIKITKIQFIGAAAFSQKELRKQIKTSEHGMWSWITGSGVFKQDDFDDDQDALTKFYRDHGYLDFEIKDVKLDRPTTNTMDIRFYVYEGRQYKVGAVKFTGNKLFNDTNILAGLQANHAFTHAKGKLGVHGLAMDTGDIFTPDGLDKDTKAVEDFYGGKGYIDVAQGSTLRVNHIPNVDTGTMDLEFVIDEGQKIVVEKININGNLKTKDKVIRRELAISPGETFDMVRVQISKERLEGLQYFDKVDLSPEPTDPQTQISGHRNLDVNVEEQNTGNLTFGAGFSSVDSLVGYVELSQGNFDLFHPPTFTGGGQKFRLKVQLGTERSDFEMSFIEPWFLDKKLSLSIDLYRHDLNFESPNNIFDEARTGMRLGLSRALWSDFFIGSISYTIEDVDISLNPPFKNPTPPGGPIGQPPHGGSIDPNSGEARVPQDILNQTSDHLFNRFGTTLAYDTRNSTRLPDHGQRTELNLELSEGDQSFYKLELKSSMYFPGLLKGHVVEIASRASVADSLSGGDVPFYDRYYLGGLDSLRGFKYRNISPREAFDPLYPNVVNEPIGGDSLLFGSLEYSLPILEKDNGLGVRVAAFFDAGEVGTKPYSLSGGNFDDDWGLGFRLNIPRLGPLRLDYGIPLTHDKYNGGSGQFQFSAGYTRPF